MKVVTVIAPEQSGSYNAFSQNAFAIPCFRYIPAAAYSIAFHPDVENRLLRGRPVPSISEYRHLSQRQSFSALY